MRSANVHNADDCRSVDPPQWCSIAISRCAVPDPVRRTRNAAAFVPLRICARGEERRATRKCCLECWRGVCRCAMKNARNLRAVRASDREIRPTAKAPDIDSISTSTRNSTVQSSSTRTCNSRVPDGRRSLKGGRGCGRAVLITKLNTITTTGSTVAMDQDTLPGLDTRARKSQVCALSISPRLGADRRVRKSPTKGASTPLNYVHRRDESPNELSPARSLCLSRIRRNTARE